ncbi:MAG: DUF356 domain-containing protein [Methanobacteriaceae archaeon]|nr:DUF356 domain-containing protein [Methanobacteriaceae archaeon]
MSLILLRADNNGKLLNSLADIERHAGLKIKGKPRLVENEFADKMAQDILKKKLKKKSLVSAVVKVQEDATKSILQVKKIHPPAHLIIVSDEYPEFETLKTEMSKAPVLKGYYSHKSNKSKK